MLESATKDEICRLENINGKDAHRLVIPQLKDGTIIRVSTRSGSYYFFEIVDVPYQQAYIARLLVRLSGVSVALLGRWRVSATFQVGKPICYGTYFTPIVERITII